MLIVVIGLGSMGRRRIRLLKQYNSNFEIIGVDNNNNKRNQVEDEFKLRTYDNFETAFLNHKLSYAFVCTSPQTHNFIIENCLEHNLHVFTELNLVDDGYDKNIKLSQEKNKVLFLSSTFLYREEIKFIKKEVKSQTGNINYSYHIGQYLPDWHPWENYQNYFVGNKRTNGCREIFAIELPWLTETFGNIKDILVKKSKMSNLKLDYDDNFIVILEHESGHKGVLIVDIVSRKAVRNLEIFGEYLYLSWNGTPESLKILNLDSKSENKINLYQEVNNDPNYNKYIIENAYYEEIKLFFDIISGKNKEIYGFEKDKIILDLIDKIEDN